MVDAEMSFDQRVARLSKKHQAMSRGYVARMRQDGLIVVKPRRAKLAISPKSIVIFVMAFFVFKGFLLSSLGPTTYEERLASLSEGTAGEKAGAWVMQADPLTQVIADQLGPFLR